jgi:hypothetical protein
VRFVLIQEAKSAPLASQVTPEWLQSVATAGTIQLNRDVSPSWGGEYMVRVGTATDLAAGDIAFAILDDLPVPNAIAYHDVDGSAIPVAFLGLNTCRTLDDVSTAISHELCETAGDAGCNLWADDGSTEWARELCDAVESSSYAIGAVRVSDFVLPSFFVPNGRGPYSYTESVGGPRIVSGPFHTAHGGYQIQRTDGGPTVQVNGELSPHRAAKLAHWSSRANRR